MNKQYFILDSKKGWDKPLNCIDSIRLNLKLNEIKENPYGVDKELYFHEFEMTANLDTF